MSFPLLCTCRGERGPAGPQGPRGPQGSNGPQGPRGPQGIPGPAGPQGVPGLDGTSCYGESVPEGVLFTCGEDTYLVQHGERGPEGPMGLQGEVGPQGLQGERGLAGEAGPMGPQGPRGEQGPAGGANFQWNNQTIAGRWNVNYYHRSGNLIERGEINFNEDGTVAPYRVMPFFDYKEGIVQIPANCVYHEEYRNGLPQVDNLISASLTYQINEVPGVNQIFSFVLSGLYSTGCCGDVGACQPPNFVPQLRWESRESQDAFVVTSDENRITFRAGNGYGVLWR